MNIAIIEDEKITAADLAQTIQSVAPDSNIIAILSSVKAAVNYFENETMPDLIFSDIQLGDGLSFDIFKQVSINVPVIFCTAFDEYALEAFKTNSIDYILKPFSSDEVSEAIEKYKDLKKVFSKGEQNYDDIINALLHKKESTNTSSLLVHYKDKILPIKLDNVALFYIDAEIVSLITLDGHKYNLSKTLDELSKIAGDNFYRVNRQCILNRKAVVDISHYFSGKLSINISVPYHEKILVSKAKRTQFLNWMEQ